MTEKIVSSTVEQIINFYLNSSANIINMSSGPEKAYGSPLIGYASGGDSFWDTLKESHDNLLWHPLEAFKLAFPQETVVSSDLTVIVFILPQTDKTLKDQRLETEYPSERWARNYFNKEKIVGGLSSYLVQKLLDEGVKAVAPDFLPQWSWLENERFQIYSPWSHRHAAFTAGLGTFGLCDGLITASGKAHRIGSIIAKLSLPATVRPYMGIHDYCLFYSSNSCGKCIKRCPAKAVSSQGHDKMVCRNYIYVSNRPYISSKWPDLTSEKNGCGLCQAGVPCENSIPVPLK